MGHILKKKEKKKSKVVVAQYSSVHQKVARLHSGNTITAKQLLRKLDKYGTKNNNYK